MQPIIPNNETKDKVKRIGPNALTETAEKFV